MDKQAKCWGETSLLFGTRTVSVHLLRIGKGGFSSEHRHYRKTNLFHVLSGKLQIRQWPEGAGEPDRTDLGPGESMTVPVGTWHQFQALEETRCLEIYEAAPVEEDIERRTTGGLEIEKRWLRSGDGSR